MKKITIILFATLGVIFLTACEKRDTKGPIRIASIEPFWSIRFCWERPCRCS